MHASKTTRMSSKAYRARHKLKVRPSLRALLRSFSLCVSVLQCVAVCCSASLRALLGSFPVRCSVLQRVVVCRCASLCALLRFVFVALQCVAVCCSVLQCVAVCCSA